MCCTHTAFHLISTHHYIKSKFQGCYLCHSLSLYHTYELHHKGITIYYWMKTSKISWPEYEYSYWNHSCSRQIIHNVGILSNHLTVLYSYRGRLRVFTTRELNKSQHQLTTHIFIATSAQEVIKLLLAKVLVVWLF